MHVLVGGPPGSGKTTLATALAEALGLPLLSKDTVKDALMDVLGHPDDVDASQRLGRAAVHAVLACARTAGTGAVVDSTFFEHARPLVEALPEPVVEVRCELDEDEALRRYAARSAAGEGGHLDVHRTRGELRDPALLRPLGIGPVLHVDTGTAVDVPALAAAVRRAAGGPAGGRRPPPRPGR